MNAKQGTGLMLLPPAADKCQVCATKHEPDAPHNAQSLFYCVHFKMENGRDPTWEDALAHCSDRTYDRWRTELAKFGVHVKRRKQ